MTAFRFARPVLIVLAVVAVLAVLAVLAVAVLIGLAAGAVWAVGRLVAGFTDTMRAIERAYR